MWQSFSEFAYGLGPVAIVIGMALWAAAGGLLVWALGQRRVARLRRRIAKLERQTLTAGLRVASDAGGASGSDDDHAKSDGPIVLPPLVATGGTSGSPAPLPKAQPPEAPTSPLAPARPSPGVLHNPADEASAEATLEAAERLWRAGLEEQAGGLIVNWLKSQGPAQARIMRHAADWALGFRTPAHEFGTTADAQRFLMIARALAPQDSDLAPMEAEVANLVARTAGGAGGTGEPAWADVDAYAGPAGLKQLGDIVAQAVAAGDVGNHHLARLLYHRAWAIQRRANGPDDPRTLDVRSHLAAALRRLGRVEEAARLNSEPPTSATGTGG